MADYTIVYVLLGVLLFAFVGIVIWFIIETKPLSGFQPPNKKQAVGGALFRRGIWGLDCDKICGGPGIVNSMCPLTGCMGDVSRGGNIGCCRSQ